MIKVAVVGCGYWGPNLIRNFYENPSCKVDYCCDMDNSKVEKVLRKYPSIRGTNDFDDLLSSAETDAIAIATPASTHYEMAKKALEAGKHILVEKPLSLTTEESEKLNELAEKKNLILMVGHTFEYNPAVRKLKEILNTTDVGKALYMYSARLNLGVFRDDVNVMWNLAPHDISIFLYLIEEFPIAVSAIGKSFVRNKLEDVVFMYLEFPSGIIAHLHISCLDPSKIRKTTIVCERKMIIYDDLDNEGRIKIYDKGFETTLATDGGIQDYIIRPRAGDIYIPKIDNSEPLRIETEHFIECIEKGEKPLTDGLNGIRVVNVLETAESSLREGGTIKKTQWMKWKF
ncbi:MAG: gfo/Idh/MocA family oxidoreductase [Candidatus Schekmanbacteria bacterium]|nr:MAG: gfo/Idh/MocA family oxidoreductase [Candidatus Schekmanbacteria bacterium]